MPPLSYLKHGVSEEGLQRPLLTVRFGLVLLEQLVKVSVLLAVSQNLQAVLMIPHKLLVDVQHGQQDVKQVRWKEKQKYYCMYVCFKSIQARYTCRILKVEVLLSLETKRKISCKM